MSSIIGGCLPTREQELLTRAALWQNADAIDAWNEWRARVAADSIDVGSTRLLPLLYLNLRALGVEHPLMEDYKEIYRTAWIENQKHVHHAAKVLLAMKTAGIRTMALKGAALIAVHYKEFGARPMGDFDLLVPTEQLSAAMNVLTQLGWKEREFVPVYNSRAFTDGNAREIDLHWHVLQECLSANADADFWSGAVSTRVGDVATLILNPTDQLLHICMHGLRWNATPPIRWIADALTILNSASNAMDWERLIAQVQAREIILPMRTALAYLRDKMRAPIPARVLERLNALPIARVERWDYATRTIPPQFLGIKLYWVGYLRLAKRSELGRLGLLEYLRRVWDLEHVYQVPLFAYRRAANELRWRMRMKKT